MHVIKSFGLYCFLAGLIFFSGCTTDQMNRFGYMMGSQYSCMQANDNLPNEAARDMDCTMQTREKERDYEAYRRARNEEGAQN